MYIPKSYFPDFDSLCFALDRETEYYPRTIREAVHAHVLENLDKARGRKTNKAFNDERRVVEARFVDWVVEDVKDDALPLISSGFVFENHPLRVLARATALALIPFLYRLAGHTPERVDR